MLVDNPLQYQPYPSSANFNDFNDIFNTELFANDVAGNLNATSSSNSPPTASSSRASSPQSPYQPNLLTPPQSAPVHQFPDYSPSSFFNFLDDEPSKQLDPMSMSMSSSAPFDFMSAFSGVIDIGMDSSTGMDATMDMSNSAIGLTSDTIGIDPQLVGTPSTLSEIGEEEEEDDQETSPEEPSIPTKSSFSKSRSAKKPPVKEKQQDQDQDQEQERLTLVIQPVKAAGHGKARKGTILSGGITKKHASSPPLPSAVATLAKDLDITNSGSFIAPVYTPPSAFTPTNIYPSKSSSGKAGNENKDKDDDDDDLPHDWRPSPEVFAKMTSKEKRQLRNKISARNFRVRRKEYISTLEGDIAERDRLLDAIRTELGSTQSENFALRQEIAALKHTLLEGRRLSTSDELPLNLPPPAPLPAQSAAATLAQQSATSPPSPPPTTTSQLLTANTQKDASANGRFWGGANSGMRMGMGGITPVHRVMLPEVSVTDLLASQFKKVEKLQENMNPLLNDATNTSTANPSVDMKMPFGFDNFADVNPFTMKTLDAYRMHLWGKMAAQHQAHLQQQQQHQQHQNQNQNQNLTLTGLASSLRPAFFSTPYFPSPPSSKHSLLPPYTTPPSTTTPSSPPPPYQSAPPSPILGLGKSSVLEKLEREREREKERERERQREKEASAMVATIASQTLLRKMGSAFWDAFSGSSSSSSIVNTSVHGGVAGNAFASGGGSGASRAWDADKVRRVLEGKAVVRVVDIEDLKPAKIPQAEKSECATRKCSCTAAMTDILEESMRSLSIGKKA